MYASGEDARQSCFRIKFKVKRYFWLEIDWLEKIPPFKIFGFAIWPGSSKKRVTRTVRLYPRSFGLDPRTATRKQVMACAEEEGYKYCPTEVAEAIRSTALVQRRGYLVFPLSDGTQIILFANGGGAQLFLDEDLTPTTIENSHGWSIVMAIPDND